MRAKDFIKEEERLDELLPLVTGAASLVGGAASLAGGVASGVGAVAKGVGKGVGAAASGVGKAVGAVGNATAKGVGKVTGTNEPDTPEVDNAKNKMLSPGKKINLPTQGPGGPSPFKVTKQQGDEVEIENPDAAKPGEPKKFVFKKDDLKKNINL